MSKHRSERFGAESPGSPVMSVESVESTADRTVVETTGAVYTIHHTNPGRIVATQKLNGPRQVFAMELNTSFEKLALNYRDANECTLYCPFLDFGFHVRVFADSLLWIQAGQDVRVCLRGDWLPEYHYAEAGNMLLLDKTGGCGHYALASAAPYGSPLHLPNPGLSFSQDGWEARYTLPATRRLLSCVAPPRPFNQRQFVADRIVHHMFGQVTADGAWDMLPDLDKIPGYAAVGNILTLHVWARGAGPLKGMGANSRDDLYTLYAPWAARRFEPLDDKRLRAVIERAHEHGMRVLPYLSPLFFPGTAHEFLAELNRFLAEWEFDGVYYDGVSHDIIEAYEIMKGTRRLIGPERILYVHIPSPILGSSYGDGKYAYCPFIDTYADFILRAEHIEDFDDAVLRYTISGYNISNAIGLACNYDYSLDFNRELLTKALDYRVGVPYWVGLDHYLKDRGEALGQQYPPEAATQKLMREVYFPALDRLTEKP